MKKKQEMGYKVKEKSKHPNSYTCPHCGWWIHNKTNKPGELHATLTAYDYECPIEHTKIVEKQKEYMRKS